MEKVHDHDDLHNKDKATTLCKEKETPELHFDLLVCHILSRLQVKSLMRFKCVCKQWRCLIEDDVVFIRNHMNRASPRLVSDSEFIITSHDPELTSTTTTLRPSDANHPIKTHQGFSIIGIYDGLVVEMISEKYFQVRNPATRQILNLPNPHPGLISGTWFDLNPQTGEAKLLLRGYFVMRSRQDQLFFLRSHQILSIGRDQHWRHLTRPHHGAEILFMSSSSGYQSYNDNNMYYFINFFSGQDLPQVISFDIRSERFANKNLPRGVFSNLFVKVYPFWWNNRLALGAISRKELQVVVLEKQKDGTYKWTSTENKIIVPLGVIRSRFEKEVIIVPLEAKSDHLWFKSDQGTYKFCYDMKMGIIKETILNEPYQARAMFEYRPSLKSLEGMRPEANGW